MRAQREGDVRRWWRPGLWLGGKWARGSLLFVFTPARVEPGVEPVMNSRQPGALFPPSGVHGHPAAAAVTVLPACRSVTSRDSDRGVRA